jgi:hypothetical protein
VNVSLFYNGGIAFISIRDDRTPRYNRLGYEILNFRSFTTLDVFKTNPARGFATFFSGHGDNFLVIDTAQEGFIHLNNATQCVTHGQDRARAQLTQKLPRGSIAAYAKVLHE